MASVDELIKLYAKSRQNLINIIVEKETRGNSTQFQSSMLREINAELSRLQAESDVLVEKVVGSEYESSATGTIKDYEAAYKAAGKIPPKMLSSFSVLHKEAIKVLVDNAKADLGSSIDFVGRKLQDNIRQAGIDAIADKITTGTTVQKTKDALVDKLKQQGISAVEYKRKNGTIAHMQLDAYAKTVARSTTAEATNQALINQAKELNEDLVLMSEHSGTCPICAPLQGRVYSISGKDPRFPRLDFAYGAGYANIHPNCEHRLSLWIEGLRSTQELNSAIKSSNRSFDTEDWSAKERAAAKRNLDAYNKGQEYKRKLYTDRKQWERYKMQLGNDNVPKTLSAFRGMKKSNNKNWQQLQSDYRAAN